MCQNVKLLTVKAWHHTLTDTLRHRLTANLLSWQLCFDLMMALHETTNKTIKHIASAAPPAVSDCIHVCTCAASGETDATQPVTRAPPLRHYVTGSKIRCVPCTVKGFFIFIFFKYLCRHELFLLFNFFFIFFLSHRQQDFLRGRSPFL